MPVNVETEVVIHRPPLDVYAFVADPENAPRWYVNIKGVNWKTQPPLRVGSRVEFLAEFLGRRISYTYEFVALEPARRVVMRTSEGPFPMETIYELSPSQGGTKMVLRNRGSPSGFGVVLAPFVSMAMRRANRKDLDLLKRLLERASR